MDLFSLSVHNCMHWVCGPTQTGLTWEQLSEELRALGAVEYRLPEVHRMLQTGGATFSVRLPDKPRPGYVSGFYVALITHQPDRRNG